MALDVDRLNAVLSSFVSATKYPESYISCQPKHESSLTSCTKSLFEVAASHAEESIASSCPLSELITEGFDDEQIWQELELQNRPAIDCLLRQVAKAVSGRSRLHLSHPRRHGKGGAMEGEDEGDLDDERSNAIDDEGSSDEEVTLNFQRTEKSRGRKIEEDSDESDESDTNFDIDELESRTRQKRNVSSDRPSNRSEAGGTNPSVVDDMFFKLDDMERFLEMEDAKEAKRVRQMEGTTKGERGADDEEDDDDEGLLDYFIDDESGDEDFGDEDSAEDGRAKLQKKKRKTSTRDWMYTDFFSDPGRQGGAAPAKKKVRFQSADGEREDEEEKSKDFDEDSFADADDDLLEGLSAAAAARSKDELLPSTGETEEKEADPSSMSSFEKRQEKLRKKIDDLEKSNVAEKSWQLVGEVTAGRRPENSLLEEMLEFDVTTRPAPVITEETTQTLEGAIRQRILDQAWDDVQRKAKPKEEAFEFKKRVTLDQEKSKLSLGEIYEQEYIKQTRKEAEQEKEDPLHVEIKESMDSLFVKLDALSNFCFTPKPIAPEVKIVANTPAIAMEEVTPINVAESSLLAPEEIQEREKGNLKGKTEKTSTDRKRELRKKKQGQRERARDRERREKLVDRMKPGLGNKFSKKAALARLEKSSKAPSSNTTILKDVDSAKGNLKSSKAFFSKLQEEVAADVHGFKQKKTNKKKLSGTQLKM